MIAMDLGGIPLFAMLHGRLGYLNERQRVIAENVSNSDTPGYSPNDLKAFTFSASMAGVDPARTLTVTQPGHMPTPNAKRTAFRAVRGHDSETTLDGNSVVLEEEMLKMTDARMNYDAAISFYQKSLGLLQLAIRAPGK